MKDDLTPPCKAEEGRFSGEDHGDDELVDCEIEAAQALACLAHPASNNDELLPGPSGTTEEQVIAIQSEGESEPKTSSQHAPNCLSVIGSRRSRQNLTEEEKEERRLCRVLANRESARQTIRRRQAMYEELTRKAADLASENENLKKKKELAAKEYDSLKGENASLRLQIAKREKAESEETDGASRSKPVKISNTSTGPAPAPAPAPNPTSHFNQSLMPPFFWPSIVQPVNSFLLQCSSQNISGVTSMVPSPTSGETNSTNRQQSSNPGLCILPFPCLIPCNPQNSLFLPQNNPFLPWSETSGVHRCSTSYLNMENNQAATAQECETAAPDSVKVAERDFLHVTSLGFLPDGGSSEGSRQPSGVPVPSRETMVRTAAPSSHIQPGTSGQNDTPRQLNPPDINAISSTSGHVGDASEKLSQESITCSSEKSADAIAATAEARRRRKELLHLKGHHSDQFGSHC